MKNTINIVLHSIAKLKIVLIAVVLSGTSLVDAQTVAVPCSQVENFQPGQECTKTGVIEIQDFENGFLTISGIRYGFYYDVSKIFLGGEEVSAAILDTDMVVRFVLDSASTLLMIDILGPFEKIRLLLLKQS